MLEKKQFRIYPQESLFSHVLGQINDDNLGVSGIEKYFNEYEKDRFLPFKKLLY